MVFFVSIIFLFFSYFEEVITPPAPFLSASLINLLPSLFFPLIAKNKLSFLIDLVSMERPFTFREFFIKIFLNILLFCKKIFDFLIKNFFLFLNF